MNASSSHIRPWLAGLAALLNLAALHHPTTLSASAQEPIRVSGEVTCTECVITLDTIVTIGGLDGPGLGVIANISRAALDPQVRILISNPMQAEFSVFDSTGAFIRSVGGRGDGPGSTLARYHTDGMIVGFVAGSRYLLGYGETDAGVPCLHLLEPAIVRPPAN